jgi:hypothetical protein
MRETLLIIAVWLITGATFSYLEAARLPDADVYRLSKTPEGELRVRCINGADATIRPSAVFGEITVSCGK